MNRPGRVVDFSNQSLTGIDPKLFERTEIEVLNLCNNKLTTLPLEGWENFGHLAALDLHNNRLRALPESMRRLKNVTMLNIAGNNLTKLPKWLTQLNRLTQLFVDRALDADPVIAQLRANKVEVTLEDSSNHDRPITFGFVEKL